MGARCPSQSSLPPFPSFIPSVLPSSSHPSFHPSFHPSTGTSTTPQTFDLHSGSHPPSPHPDGSHLAGWAGRKCRRGCMGWALGWRSGLSCWQPAVSTALPVAVPSTGRGRLLRCLHGVRIGELCSHNRRAGVAVQRGKEIICFLRCEASCV